MRTTRPLSCQVLRPGFLSVSRDGLRDFPRSFGCGTVSANDVSSFPRVAGACALGSGTTRCGGNAAGVTAPNISQGSAAGPRARTDGGASTRRGELLSWSQAAAAPEIRECSPAGDSKGKIAPRWVRPVSNTLGGKTATHAESPLSVVSIILGAVAAGWPIKRSELGARGVR